VIFCEPSAAQQLNFAGIQEFAVHVKVDEIEADVVEFSSAAKSLDFREWKTAMRQKLPFGFENSADKFEPGLRPKLQPEGNGVEEKAEEIPAARSFGPAIGGHASHDVLRSAQQPYDSKMNRKEHALERYPRFPRGAFQSIGE